MITNIARLLQARKPNAPVEWMQKLPQMARRLEESLFRSAQSFDEYKDTQTLKKRLQALAMAMGLRAQQQKQKSEEHSSPIGVTGSGPGSAGTPAAASSTARSDPPLTSRFDPLHAGTLTSDVGSVHASASGAGGSSGPSSPLPNSSTAVSSAIARGDVRPSVCTKHLPDVNPLMITSNRTSPEASAAPDCSVPTVNDGATAPSSFQPRHTSDTLLPGRAARNMPSSQRAYHADQRQQVLRQQQQRLLLLRHASKCPHENGTCPVTPHCSGMKRLWKHIAECKDQQCQMAHCVSSRYVLSHYHRCKDPRCAVCGPVREAIQRNHEKAKQLAMAQQVSNARVEGNSAPDHEATQLLAHRGSVPTVHDSLRTSQRPSQRAMDRSRSRQAPKHVAQTVSKHTAQSYVSAVATSDTRRNLDSSTQSVIPRVATAVGAQDVHGTDESRNQPKSSCAARVEEGTSLLNSFTATQIQAHLQSLKTGVRMTAAKIRQKCTPVLRRLTEHENAWIFMQPVDPVELNLPDYFDVIKNPMDLGSIKKRMDNNCYKVISEFAADVRLTFDNAISYNGEGSDVCKVAKDMKSMFERLYQSMISSIDAEEEQRKSSGDVCVLCGCEKLLFEPTVYYCNGSCNGQRIRRNSYYYTGGRNQYHWCQQCFNEMKDKEPLEFPDMTLWKKDLQKKKNDEMHEEPWVECSQCKRWVHQICALFNGRMNKGTTIYHCPFCFMARRGAREPQPRPLGAKDFRHTKLSLFLEERVIKLLDDLYQNHLTTAGQSVEAAPPIYVRQLSNIDKVHQVKPRMFKRYGGSSYAREFPVRSKCILLFQEMDGVDVILFGMYLYEYGHNCPQPNQRRVYVSYLDSVYYFRPRKFRTMVYHEMLIAYLAHVKQRGFHTVHIWACPPCKGDDYIFFCHPEDQKTPKDDRLRSWYITLLRKAKHEGIVTHITNLWDQHFKSDLDVSCVPYFEGDYWPGEAENVLKALEDEAIERNDTKSRKSCSVVKSKSKARSVRGLRSDGLVQTEHGQDVMIARMGKIIEPMKDAFIVAYLNPRLFASEMGRRSQFSTLKAHATRSTTPPDKTSGQTELVAKKDLVHIPASHSPAAPSTHESTMITNAEDPSVGSPAGSSSASSKPHEIKFTEKLAEEGQINKVHEKTSSWKHDGRNVVQTEDRNQSGTMSGHLDHTGQGVPTLEPRSNNQGVEGDRARLSHVDETEDKDDIIESEFYDTRQQFLNLCQGNHYQFDELRRAKHTSMMSLYHMHNPDVPKFTVACSSCGTDINSGVCYNSEKDPEFHLCQDCYQKSHKVFAAKLPFRRTSVGGDAHGQLTEEQRRERQRSIQLHMQLLQHASGCRNHHCPSANCSKMKNLLKHGATCATRVQGGCAICRRIWALLQIHARQCRRDNCTVPKCRQLKEQLRAIAQQQAQMDERRRAAMNAAYRR